MRFFLKKRYLITVYFKLKKSATDCMFNGDKDENLIKVYLCEKQKADDLFDFKAENQE